MLVGDRGGRLMLVGELVMVIFAEVLELEVVLLLGFLEELSGLGEGLLKKEYVLEAETKVAMTDVRVLST